MLCSAEMSFYEKGLNAWLLMFFNFVQTNKGNDTFNKGNNTLFKRLFFKNTFDAT